MQVRLREALEARCSQQMISALLHGLTVVTRNVADFKSFGVPLLNPFEA